MLMASPSETTLIVLGAAGLAGLLSAETGSFWRRHRDRPDVTPLLASSAGHGRARVDRQAD